MGKFITIAAIAALAIGSHAAARDEIKKTVNITEKTRSTAIAAPPAPVGKSISQPGVKRAIASPVGKSINEKGVKRAPDAPVGKSID